MVSSGEINYRFVLVGDSGVGKTCLFSKYTKGVFPTEIPPNVATDIATVKHELKEKGNYAVQVVDASGKPKYRETIAPQFKKTTGIIVMYDITNKATFDNVPKWIKLTKLRGEPNMMFMIVGSKSDEVKKDKSLRKVSRMTVQDLATEHKAIVDEVSALEEPDVRRIFEKFIVHIHEKEVAEEESNKKIKLKPGMPRPKPVEFESAKPKAVNVEDFKAKLSDRMSKKPKPQETDAPKQVEPEIQKPKQAEPEIKKPEPETSKQEVQKPKPVEPEIPTPTLADDKIPKVKPEEKVTEKLPEEKKSQLLPILVLLGAILLVVILRSIFKE